MFGQLKGRFNHSYPISQVNHWLYQESLTPAPIIALEPGGLWVAVSGADRRGDDLYLRLYDSGRFRFFPWGTKFKKVREP